VIIDVGTGASCIYPLLGARLLSRSKFIAIDNDSEALASARTNVSANALDERIEVREGEFFSAVDADEEVDFTLCNPPFYAAVADIGRHPRRERSGSGQQLLTEGGEFVFLSKLAQKSSEQSNVKWFTTLIGLKRDVLPFESKLKSLGAEKIVRTTLQPARTARWAVAWTFFDGNAVTLNLCNSARATLKIRWRGVSQQEILQSAADVLMDLDPKTSQNESSIHGAGIQVDMLCQAEHRFELDLRNSGLPSGRDFHSLARNLREDLTKALTEKVA